ncbi:MAG TPA: tRNA pseudouridine(55) synthase TruB [Bryobacteraceae bacterium]|nr:tRNA pseudouridine(55) synthase TruB [Bryobacteraceae bacterium]
MKESSNSVLDGVIVVNKPEGWTSHDVVAKMRGIAGTRRVGHLGTLDPIATGVLPVMIGQVTRLAQFWHKSEKAYEAVVRFGFATTTYDKQGDPLGPVTEPNITAEQIEACIAPMRGEIEQTPPPVSAKKINGVPAYKLARKNIPVDLTPVKITIYELTLLEVNGVCARLRVRCSAGSYIRTIAHQLGILLGCGAHVDALVRTRSGPFALENAFTLEQLQQLKDDGNLQSALLPAAELLPHFPAVFVDDITTARIRQGRDFNASPFRVSVGTEHVKAIDPAGNLVAIGRIALPHVYHPVVVLN